MRKGYVAMKKVKQFKKCPQCGRLYNDLNMRYCLNDNYPLIDHETNNPLGEQLKDFDRPVHKPTLADLKREQAKESVDPGCVPKCPTCGSEIVKKISTMKRATHMHLFGFFSKTAVSQFCCENCGYKW